MPRIQEVEKRTSVILPTSHGLRTGCVAPTCRKHRGRDENFFFQAADGIRDLTVTGVQTCALPICAGREAGDTGTFAGAAPEDTSRTKPFLSSCEIRFWNAGSNALPTFCATSASVARPSIAASTTRSPRCSRLVLPDASCTPLPDFE